VGKKFKINVSKLQIGMSVVELDRPWIETPFLLQGFKIGTSSDIAAIQEYCEFVFIDSEFSPDMAISNRKKKPDVNKPGFFNNLYKKVPDVVTTSVEKELPKAKVIYNKASTLVKTCMEDVILGNAINEQALKENVSETVESILRNPDAMMWLSRLSHKDDHTSKHCINTCILSVTFGRFIGIPNDELEKLSIAALMHDIGKLQVPTEILNKPGELNDAEMALVRKHPTHSRNLLMSAGRYFASAVDVAYSHHERMDGTGYPRGLTAHQISPFARIIAIIDTYDSMTSEQVYRAELSPFESLKFLNTNKGTKYDEQLTKWFIKLIGVFPVGSVVELTNNQIGIVITSNREDNLRPKVLIMLDHNKMPIERSIMNLARKSVDALGRPIKIARTLRKGDYGINQQELVAEGIEFTVLN